MKRLLVLIAALSMLFGLFLTGCDSDDNGGGGATPVATVTSPMAGIWDVTLVLGGGVSLKSRMTIDSNGVITQYISPWWVCGPFNVKKPKGTLTQTGGEVQYACAGAPAGVWTDQYRLRTVSADRLQGSIVVYNRSNLAIPKRAIVLTRRK